MSPLQCTIPPIELGKDRAYYASESVPVTRDNTSKCSVPSIELGKVKPIMLRSSTRHPCSCTVPPIELGKDRAYYASESVPITRDNTSKYSVPSIELGKDQAYYAAKQYPSPVQSRFWLKVFAIFVLLRNLYCSCLDHTYLAQINKLNTKCALNE